MKKFGLPLGTLLVGAVFLSQPQPAQAVAVAATICTVNVFPCPLGNTVASGVSALGPAIMPFNSWISLPFNFIGSDNFSGSVLVVDRFVNGVNSIYSWGTGVASDNGALGVGSYLDVGITQSYSTVAGFWNFSEINIGSCNAAGALNSNAGPPGPLTPASGSAVAGVVNNAANLGVLTGSCGLGPWANSAGVGGLGVGAVTNLTSYAQFYFNAGANPALNQAITLPWGDDFPDPTFDSGNFPTLSDLESDPDLTQITPEPAAFGLVGAGLALLFALNRRRRHS